MYLCFPPSRPEVQTKVSQTKIIQTREGCPDFGCPIYPPELTPEVLEFFSTKAFQDTLLETSKRESTEKKFEFGTKTLAMLTQRGLSHTYNQDRSVTISPFLTLATPSDVPSFLVGVFDGHGVQGHIVASHVLRDLPERLAQKLNEVGQNPTDESIVKALNETFIEVDIYAPPNFLFGGCTATVTLRRGSKLYIANAGDSQTIVVSLDDPSKPRKEPKVAFQTRKDKASLPDEYKRITDLGGRVRINNQTNDSRVIVYSVAQRETIMLAMSRSLGDWEWKAVGVTAEPLIDVLDLNDYPNSFLIAASDGMWDRRRREFYAKQFGESFRSDHSHPFLKLLDVFKKITPKEQTGYRDDKTGIVIKL